VDDRRSASPTISKETKIANRASISGKDPNFPLSGSRDEQVCKAQDICKQEEIKKLRSRELWEVVGLETGEIGIEDLAELFSATRAILTMLLLFLGQFSRKAYFKIRPDRIEVSGGTGTAGSGPERKREGASTC
jgi:hypothetical protein